MSHDAIRRGKLQRKMAEVHGNRTHVENNGKTTIHERSGAESGALGAQLSDSPPDLQVVIEAWPTLPEKARLEIVAMVRESVGEGG